VVPDQAQGLTLLQLSESLSSSSSCSSSKGDSDAEQVRLRRGEEQPLSRSEGDGVDEMEASRSSGGTDSAREDRDAAHLAMQAEQSGTAAALSASPAASASRNERDVTLHSGLLRSSKAAIGSRVEVMFNGRVDHWICGCGSACWSGGSCGQEADQIPE